MERTRYLVHGKLMIIRPNGRRQWRGLWNEPGDPLGIRRTWPFGEEDPRPFLTQVQLERKPGPAQVGCNQEANDQLHAICDCTGETQRAALDRLSLLEEARLLADQAEPIERVRSVGIEARLGITAWPQTVKRLEWCAARTQERVGHLAVRIIGQEWRHCFQ